MCSGVEASDPYTSLSLALATLYEHEQQYARALKLYLELNRCGPRCSSRSAAWDCPRAAVGGGCRCPLACVAPVSTVHHTVQA